MVQDDPRRHISVRVRQSSLDEIDRVAGELYVRTGIESDWSAVVRMLLARGLADYRREYPALSAPHSPSTDGKGAARRS